MIRWVFLDVGNTLVNEDPAFSAVYKSIHRIFLEEGHQVDFADLLREREHIQRTERVYAPFVQQVRRRMGEDAFAGVARRYREEIYPRWTELHSPIAGMDEVINFVRSAGLNLGIIADQPKETVDLLKELGWYESFAIMGLSEVVGHKKPSLDFYRWALHEARCAPEEAVMVGDRIDNDMRPSRELGMRHVWFTVPPQEKGPWNQMDEHDQMYLESAAKLTGSFLEPLNQAETPDHRAMSSAELIQILERL